MTEQIYTDVKTLLAQMSEKIGQGAEYGWGVVLKQQYVVAVQGLLWFVGGIIGLFLAKHFFKVIKGDDELVEHPEMIGVFFVFAGSVAAIISGLNLAITHFINPDYYALQFFIGLVK